MKRDRPTPKQEERLLAWVNKQRVQLGRKPIGHLERGDPKVADSCPIAKSLGFLCDVEDTHWRHYEVKGDYSSDIRQRLPIYVQDFVKRFDRGNYPGLEA